MWQFIISGYVPGTDIQITFDIIATFVGVFVASIILWVTLRRQKTIRHEINDMIARVEHFKEISL